MAERTVPTGLRTEYASTPMCIETDRPRFSWEPGRRQTAYRIRVASRPEDVHGDPHWDSGRVFSETAVGIAYDGPPLETGRRYYWAVRVWNENTASDWSDESWWEMGLGADDWKAAWIRRGLRDEGFEDPRFDRLRREFVLEDGVVDARVYVAAFHQASIRINGERVGQGQSFCYPDRQYYKTYDVTDHLRFGRNAIGVTNVWTGRGKGRPEGEPGVLVQLSVEYDDGSEETILSDGSWQVTDGPWQATPNRSPAAREPVEIVDARRQMPGWAEPGFDDGNWEAPDVVGRHPAGPWEELIGQRREVEWSARKPKSICKTDYGSYVVDFGRVYAGVPVIEFDDGDDGRRVEIRGGYRLDESGRVSTTKGVQWTDMHYEYVQRDGEQTFRPFIFLAFRYLEVEGAGEPLEGKIRMLERHNGVPNERAAAFESSNEMINDVWELSRHSALYGSQEQFLDTPTREKGQFISDSLDISMTTMAAFRERTLTRQALLEFCDSQRRYWSEEGRVNAVYPTGEGKRDIPDYTELFAEWVWQYYRESGDRRLLERAYPVLESIAEYVAANVDSNTGLITELAGGDRDEYRHGIVDWPEEMRYGYDMDATALTTVNVLGVAVFRRVADAAAVLDRPATKEACYRDLEASLRESINEQLLGSDGIYVDGLYRDDTPSDHASQHANAFPLAFDIVPENAVETVADHVVEGGTAMGPMTAYWLLESLAVAGRDEALVAALTDPERDGWADILERGGTFTWESWKARDLPDDDRFIVSESHAWGATALAAIQRRLLGVRTAAPTASEVIVSPPRSGLRRAEGRVPTERGPVVVSWERDGAVLIPFDLSIEVPFAMTATVVLPTERPDEIVVRLDGENLWTERESANSLPPGVANVEKSPNAIVCVVNGGTYRFELSRGYSDGVAV